MKNYSIMKKILITLIMFFCISNVFSQYTNNNYDVYSAKDMNIKGKVKKMTERTFYTDASGKVLNNEMKTGWKYNFDENGNLINKFAINLDYEDHYKKYDYEYLNGKISNYSYDEYWQGKPYKTFFYYSPSTITIKTPKGKILEVHSLSNNKVIEITEYYEEKPSRKQKYDYNTSGQITKKTYKCLGMFCKGPDHFDMYEYNKQGDLSKKEQHSTLEWITTYNYNYDNNKNWTKCTSEFYKPGEDKDHRIYQQITREWEFYNESGSSKDYDFDFGDLELKGTNSKHSEDDYDFDFGDLELKGTNSKNSKDDYFDFGDIELKGSNCGCMVTIGQQVWAKENLNTERFRNGDLIPEAKTKEEWTKAKDNKQPAWCYYNNDSANGTKYGKLYNWYAINDPRGLAPNGWHIPSTQEVGELVNFLGGKDDADKKMKTTNLWMDKYKGTNSSGFSAVPGGFRSSDGKFWNGTFEVYFWTTSLSSYKARPVMQFGLGNRVLNIYAFFGDGAYVRCIKN